MKIKNLAIISSILFLMSCTPDSKIGYIDLTRTFDEFGYKKELERTLEGVKQKRKVHLDSLELELRLMSKEANKDPKSVESFEMKKEEYFARREEFESSNSELAKEFDEKIIKQLNQYVKDYGVVYNYNLIQGANGSGSIMYADSTLNITNDVIKFINTKYKGKS